MGGYKKILGEKTDSLGQPVPCWVWRNSQDANFFDGLKAFDPSLLPASSAGEVILSLTKEQKKFPKIDPATKRFDPLDVVNSFGRHFKNSSIIEVSSYQSTSFWLSSDGLDGMRRALYDTFFNNNSMHPGNYSNASLDACLSILGSVTNLEAAREAGLVEIETNGFQKFPPFLPNIVINGNMRLPALMESIPLENCDVSFVGDLISSDLKESLESFKNTLKVDGVLEQVIYPNITRAPDLHKTFFCDSESAALEKAIEVSREKLSFSDSLVCLSTSQPDSVFFSGREENQSWYVDLLISGLSGAPLEKLISLYGNYRRYMISTWVVPGDIDYYISSNDVSVEASLQRIQVKLTVGIRFSS